MLLNPAICSFLMTSTHKSSNYHKSVNIHSVHIFSAMKQNKMKHAQQVNPTIEGKGHKHVISERNFLRLHS